MSSMGIGAWLSRFIEDNLERAFVQLQLTIALLGGFSAFILFVAFAYIDNYSVFLYLITISLGTMLGVEIPLIIRILKESFSLKTNISLSRLYSQAFWSIKKTMQSTNLYTQPYHTYIPSFGEWGFVLVSHLPIKFKENEPIKTLKYLNKEVMNKMTIFAKDIDEIDVEINKLSNHKLIGYYDEGWKKWYE